MNTEALVEQIARRVMEQLLAHQSGQQAAIKTESVLVVGECSDRQQLQQKLGDGFSFTYTADSADGEKVDPAGFDHILLASLPNSLLSALAIGLERGTEGCVMVESLLAGRTVHILEEGIVYRRYRKTAKPAFYQVFQQKEETLCSFGMEVVALDNLARVMSGERQASPSPEKASVNEVVYQVGAPSGKGDPNRSENKGSFILDQRVVGEKDLRACYEQGYRRIQLSERALVTPLAKDFVRMKEDLELTAG